MTVPITVVEGIRGGSIEVPTFQGPIKLTIPAGSQNGQKLRVKGRGVSGKAPGDLFVVLSVRLPDGPAEDLDRRLDAGDVREFGCAADAERGARATEARVVAATEHAAGGDV